MTMIFVFAILFILLAGLSVAILFLLTLQNTLKAVSPANRKMEPGMVWLWLIPFFNIVWQFIVIRRLSQSIEAEYTSRNLPVQPKPTYAMGLTMAILTAVGIVFYWSQWINAICNMTSLICFIIYWIQVNDYKNRLRNLPPAEYNDSEIFGNINQ